MFSRLPVYAHTLKAWPLGMTSRATYPPPHRYPLTSLCTVTVLLGVTQALDVDLVGFLDLGLGSVSDEDWLSSPLVGKRLYGGRRSCVGRSSI